MYDLIGDIHGHADELVDLLRLLGYRREDGIYRHPERKVIFLGDFIDRGPKIRQVLEIVRPMIDAGAAQAVMGNHELNALAYHTKHPANPGEFLRPHSEKNGKQHRQTVEQLSPDELMSHLEWFRTLPMWLDLDGLRAVHACWDDEAILGVEAVKTKQGGVTSGFLRSAFAKGTPHFDAVETILKGREAELPEGTFFFDKEGCKRTKTRTRWYLPADGHSYGTYALQSDPIICDMQLTDDVIAAARPYSITAKPVFVGHYWLSGKSPAILADNVACLDYSVEKGGFLCAYRWNGEQKLRNENFVWVGAAEGGNKQ